MRAGATGLTLHTGLPRDKPAQVHELVRPKQESIDAVRAFLAGHGVTAQSLTPNSDAISARVTIAQAEKILSTTYHVMHHADSNTNVTRTHGYSLPRGVASHVDFVCPTVHIPPAPKQPRKVSAVTANGVCRQPIALDYPTPGHHIKRVVGWGGVGWMA